MTKLLLTVHVLAAIIAIGPISVAASMFTAHLPSVSSFGLLVLRQLRRLVGAGARRR